MLIPQLVLGQNIYTPYTFTTFAGSPGVYGSQNGVGSSASFNHPGGVAVDVSNNVYVADQRNALIRKITPNGMVTTIAGTVYTGTSFNLQDGTNFNAHFSQPSGIAVDNAGNLYVGDLNDFAIRKITPSGTNWITTTIAGSKTGVYGNADGTNNTALFSYPHDLAVDGTGNIFVADSSLAGHSYTIRKITPVGTNWIVTTIAGQAGVQGTADGTNNSRCFTTRRVSRLTVMRTCFWGIPGLSGKLHLLGQIGWSPRLPVQ